MEVPLENRKTAPSRPTIVVCLEEEVYSPVSYLRLIHHLQDGPANASVSVFVLPRQLPEALERIPSAALLLMARNRHESSLLAARRAAECSVPILCDIDDYVWEFPDYSKVDRHPRIYTDEILALAAAVSTPSEDLARLVRERHPGKEIRLLPNPGNVWCDAAPAFVSGVMANSDFFRMPEMKADFFRALRDAAREAGTPLLLYYFSNDPPEHFTDDPHLRVAWMGFRSYSSYRQLLDHLRPALGFVLLRQEEFSRHKSVVKFAEFGFSGILGLYSRVEPYAGFIEDGANGFLADNSYDGWKTAALRALRLAPDARQRLLDRIARDVRDQFDYPPIHAEFDAFVSAHLRPGAPPDSRPGNLPPRQPFTFREAYAYPAWVMHAERPRLERELADARQPLLRRLLRRARTVLRPT
ncbi:MAG: hypothetical protein GX548_01970 [Lentisphaerae bacterium]|nr:hypothetical protein [Lentisphaerota bacterium]